MPTSLWLRESPPLDSDAAPLPQSVEVAVIGGGVAGASAALHLARLGARPLVLEAGQVAGRASGRNDGQLLLGLGEHYNRIVGQFGPEKARLLWDFLHRNHADLVAELDRGGIECDLRRSGGLRLAETEHELEELQEASRLLVAEDIPHRLLDAGQVREALPAGRGFFGALELPGEAILQPVRLVRGLMTRAVAEGALLAQERKVVAVTGTAGDFRVRLACGDSVRAQVVVHCTSALARELDDTGFLHRQVFPFRGQVIATDRLPAEVEAGFPDRAMSSNFCYEYFRVHDGRFVVGGMRWSVKGEEQGTLDDQGHNPEISDNLRAWTDRHFPGLRGTDFPHCWTGIMAGTGDGLPLLGSLPGRPGVFAFLAFNGYGLSFAFRAGRVLARQVLEGADDDPATALFAPRRFG